MTWYFRVLKNYAVFTGRARRKEFWYFVLVNVLIYLAIRLLADAMPTAPRSLWILLRLGYDLAILVPSLAVGVRRMHDTDRSGWWWFVPIVGLVFAVNEGTTGDNRFGPDPKAEAPA